MKKKMTARQQAQHAMSKAGERKRRGMKGFTRKEKEMQVRESASGASRFSRGTAAVQRASYKRKRTKK
jgi:hypothetical protein